MSQQKPKNFHLPTAERIKSDSILLFVSAIWGSGFIAQSIAAETMGNFTFNGIRFAIGALLLATLLRFRIHLTAKNLPGIALAGGLLFGGSTLQQVGIKTTTAANAGFITGLYVVIIPVLLFFFSRQKIHWSTWVAALLAVLGALFLSTGGTFEPAPGDWFILGGAFLWAAHVIVVGRMARRMNNYLFSFGQFAITAVLNSICVLFFEWHLPSPAQPAWLAVLFSAIFPVGLGFTLQVVGQRNAPTTDAAILFSMEAVFAALFGYWLLNETLLPLQIVGCLLILSAMLLAQFRQFFPSTQLEIEPAPGKSSPAG
ncbi:MAG: DMT family transporter [Chloroflexota bacterium]|jgi:drug/metabolite transporter (DMT)-like permease